MHDLLELVQGEMLILESDQPERIKRIRGPQLEEKMKHMRNQCKKDRDYCLKPCPWLRTHDPRLPVEATLNRRALETIANNNMGDLLKMHIGRTRSANIRHSSVGD